MMIAASGQRLLLENAALRDEVHGWLAALEAASDPGAADFAVSRLAECLRRSMLLHESCLHWLGTLDATEWPPETRDLVDAIAAEMREDLVDARALLARYRPH